MAAKLPMTNFSKGEFAPLLYARVDVPQYQAGAKKVENFIIQRYGGLSFRPGFRFAGEVDNFAHSYRMEAFMQDQNQGYVMLLGDKQLRVMAQGGFVVEADLKITAITKEAQAVLTIPFHGMVAGDRLYLDGNTGMPLNGRFIKVVAVVSASQIRTDLNTTGMVDLTASTGITRGGAPPAPPAPPAPLPDPQPEPTPPDIGGGGGIGTNIGQGPGGWKVKYYSDLINGEPIV